jgi:hypothetical protein
MDRMVERANKCYRWHDMVDAADARVCCRNQLRCSEVGTRKGEKGGREMARPYTKLAPATKTGHQDAIALARSRNDSKGREGHEVERSRDEVWRELGDVRSQDTKVFRVQHTP